MIKKLIFILLGILTLLVIGYKVFISNFEIFKNDTVFLDSSYLSNCNDKYLEVFYVPSDATVQSAIQVFDGRKNTKGSFLIRDYERFNKLISFEKIGDCSILISIEDTLREVSLTDTLHFEK